MTHPASPFEYPALYPVKVMGLNGPGFAAHARRLVEDVVGAPAAEEPTERESGGGKYLSVTIVVELASEEQRLAIYVALRGDPRVLFAL